MATPPELLRAMLDQGKELLDDGVSAEDARLRIHDLLGRTQFGKDESEAATPDSGRFFEG